MIKYWCESELAHTISPFKQQQLNIRLIEYHSFPIETKFSYVGMGITWTYQNEFIANLICAFIWFNKSIQYSCAFKNNDWVLNSDKLLKMHKLFIDYYSISVQITVIRVVNNLMINIRRFDLLFINLLSCIVFPVYPDRIKFVCSI